MLFNRVSNAIEKLEQIECIDINVNDVLHKVLDDLKGAQCAAEEEIIGEEKQCIVQNIHKKRESL